MHEFINFNHQIVRAENSALKLISPAAFYGKSVFTTVAIFNGKPFLWEKHWRRLNSNAGKIEIDLSAHSKETIEKSLALLIESNKIKNGRARLTFFDESALPIWQSESINQTASAINTADLRQLAKNLRLTGSPYYINSTSSLAGVKSGNYLENILALNEAKKRNFDEAIRLNENGVIVSACVANIFWQTDGKLFTPGLATGCLAGTTREFILENITVSEVEEKIEVLAEAEAIFLTSAGIGVVQIYEFEGKIFEPSAAAITRIISDYKKNN